MTSDKRPAPSSQEAAEAIGRAADGQKGSGRPRGFAAMDPERRKALAAMGGKAAHERGTAHQFSTDEARRAGKLGGSAKHASRGRPKPKEVPEQLDIEGTRSEGT